MSKGYIRLLISLFVAAANTASADPYTLPLQLNYGLLKKAIVSQLFKGEGGSADVWHDKHDCSFLKLYNPQISGVNGQIRLINDVQARFGTGFGGQCIPVLAWEGALETFQQPTVSADRNVLSLPVTKANAYDKQGRQLTIDKLQDLLTKVAAPKLASVKVDLNESRDDMERTLMSYLPPENEPEVKQILSTLRFNSAEANDSGIKIAVSFDAPIKKSAPKPEAPLTAAEQQQWQTVWKEWDGFFTKTINQATSETKSPELRNTLNAVLAESRSAFEAGLKSQGNNGTDPVRLFFTQTWEKLTPQLQLLAKELPEAESLRYLTFIAATDVIYQLEAVGAPFGLEITSDGLRRLARLILRNNHADSRM